jgi:hypothetical protein
MWGAALYMMRIDMPCMSACLPVACNGSLEISMRMLASRRACARACIPQQMRAYKDESLNPRTLEQEKESELSHERERARMLQEELMKATARGDKAVSDEVCGCAGASVRHCLCTSAAGIARTHARAI